MKDENKGCIIRFYFIVIFYRKIQIIMGNSLKMIFKENLLYNDFK